MGKRDDLIEKYAEDLREKCGMQPDMDLLTKVTIKHNTILELSMHKVEV